MRLRTIGCIFFRLQKNWTYRCMYVPVCVLVLRNAHLYQIQNGIRVLRVPEQGSSKLIVLFVIDWVA